MHYENDGHKFLVGDVLRMAEVYFRDALQHGIPDVEKWVREFVAEFGQELDIFASIIKHPKFSGEKEFRIATLLHPDDCEKLEFRQKRTLLARHLSLDLTIPVNGTKRLPITRVYVGPSASQLVSRISVGDLLLKYGYKDMKVEVSKVPYRVT